MSTTHMHESHTISTIPYFAGAADQHAAGGVTDIETCLCGARRRVHANGRHVDARPWDLPEWVYDEPVEAHAYDGRQARRMLVALAKSEIGAEAIRSAGYGRLVECIDRGSDHSTLILAREVWRLFRVQARTVVA